MFYKEVEKQPIVLSFQSVVSYIRFLKLVLADLNLVDIVVKPFSIGFFDKTTDYFFNCLNKILLSVLNLI